MLGIVRINSRLYYVSRCVKFRSLARANFELYTPCPYLREEILIDDGTLLYILDSNLDAMMYVASFFSNRF